MKKIKVIILVLGLGTRVFGQAAPLPSAILHPYFLRPGDKIPNVELESPGGMIWGPDKKTLELKENSGAPDAAVMKALAAPGLFEDIKRLKSAERSINTFYWHRDGALDYCHLRDSEGNNWYGWKSGGDFNWVLWRGNRFWWKDPFAGHWLYYRQNYWWRADGQGSRTLQVLTRGEYFLCDQEGKIVKDMGQDGEGSIISAPGRYQGDFHHGGHGGHHENHSPDAGSGQAPANPQAPSAASP